jgi:hypothetical protein
MKSYVATSMEEGCHGKRSRSDPKRKMEKSRTDSLDAGERPMSSLM